jgi:hypothetical protein
MGRRVMIIKLGDVLYIIACVIAAITIAHAFSDYFSRGVLAPQPLLGALVLFLIGLGLRLGSRYLQARWRRERRSDRV